jgi:hypothetical protein
MNNTLISTVKTGSKDVLARLLATENLAVEHSATAQTASFDTANRVLTLPIWQDMSDNLYDMLVGHEVAHALWTPMEEWRAAMFLKGNAHAPIFKQIVNIVEDARIERLIKAKFPGLRRDFFHAYRDLAERDFFGLNENDMDDLTVIDRLNLHFKIGNFETIPFEADEQVWVQRLEGTKTFADVVAVSSDLFDLIAPELDEPQPAEDDGDEDQDEEGAGMPAPSEASGSDEEGSDSETDADGDSGASNNEDGDEEDANTTGMEDDTDDGESADSIQISDPNSNIGSTQRAFEDAIRGLTDDEAPQREYIDRPVPNLADIIISPEKIHTDLFNHAAKDHRDEYNEATRAFAMFERDSKKTINMMVQQFIRRQAADEQQRTSIAQTGILDVNKMHSYKWNEDLFLRHEEIADGKNHGFVMFIDWSASMYGILDETIQQLIQFVLFCRKVNVPFEVYAFTSYLWEDVEYDADGQPTSPRPVFWTGNEENSVGEFQLLNFLSSKMNNRQMKTALVNMMYIAQNNRGYGAIPRRLQCGSTPLNEAILAAIDIVPEFRAEHRLQIVNTLFLTDGEASSRFGYRYGIETHVRDPKTKKTYEASRGGATESCLEMFQDTTGSKAIGIYLNEGNRMPWSIQMSDEDLLSYKKQGWTSTTKSGYTEYFVVKADKKVDNTLLDALDSDVSYTRLKNAFMKASAGRVNSRVILNRVVDLLAI